MSPFWNSLFTHLSALSWPIVALVAIFAFRKPASRAFKEIKRFLLKAGGWQLELTGSQQPGKTPLLSSDVAQFGRNPDAPLKEPPAVAMEAVREHIAAMGEEERTERIIREGALVLVMYQLEITARWIYGSQLRLVHLANRLHAVNPSMAMQIFERAKEESGDVYAATRYDQWLGFLLDREILYVDPEGKLRLTELGESFLEYIRNTGMAHKAH